MSLFMIDHEKCTRDGLCATDCPANIIAMNEHGPEPVEGAEQSCINCGHCVAICPYGALTLIEYMHKGDIKKTVERDGALCKGCGVCMATCPKQGVFIRGFKLEQLSAQVDAALQEA